MKDTEDIYKEAEQERKNEMKANIVKDFGDIFKGVISETDNILSKEKRKKAALNNALVIKHPFIYKFQKFIKIILYSLLLLILINIILFNIWIFKIFVGDLF